MDTLLNLQLIMLGIVIITLLYSGLSFLVSPFLFLSLKLLTILPAVM
ncbi:MAG: hypothetical protein CISAcid_12560 [uncultured Acidilobus sp. CIS]|jgi:hypothetical protein|nr:MAG: hypothetical protein CISAcid_12560 [uncultured Acidilobus sp. CIS]